MEVSGRLDHVEQMLDDHGRDIGPVRVAAGRSGLALGFPRDPMAHVSWIAFAVAGGLIIAIKRRRSRVRLRRRSRRR